MADDIVLYFLNILALLINLATIFLCLPRRRSILFFITTVAAATIVATAGFSAFGIGIEIPFIRGIIYLPVILYIFEGYFFKKIFIFFAQLFIGRVLLTWLSLDIPRFILNGEPPVLPVIIIAVLSSALYMFLVLRYGKKLLDRLYEGGTNKEWALYSISAAFSFAAELVTEYYFLNDPGIRVIVVAFLIWNFIMLCFAIINTHEKAREKYNAEFARDIISTGRDHYQQVDEMYDKLRILHHDYKYHLGVVRESLRSGDAEEADKYLTGVEEALTKYELPHYCKNSVLNALLANYAERCARTGIVYDVHISLPAPLNIPNYELCIILGNLLENAAEACEKLSAEDSTVANAGVNAARKITVKIKPVAAQLVVMVKNSYGGGLPQSMSQNGGELVSAKTSGGLGLRSVRAVAAKYGGELINEWNDTEFAAYVTVRL